jgi:phosphatidate cytidylyltransferase
VALGNLAQRFLVAVVAVPILLFILHLHRPEPTWALLFIASLLAMQEFFAMTLPKEDRFAAVVLGGIACLVFFWWDPVTLNIYRHSIPPWVGEASVASSGAVALIFAVVVPMLWYLFKFRDIPTVANRTTATVMGIVYAGFLTTFIAKLKLIDPNQRGETVLLVLLVAWLADTGGYFAGRFIGGAKLYEAVSPKKTVEGAVGGLLASVVWALFGSFVYLRGALPVMHAVPLAIVAGALGQAGDLGESLLKRSTGVKDSGAIVPGHGGILDRVDALIVTSTVVYLYGLWCMAPR